MIFASFLNFFYFIFLILASKYPTKLKKKDLFLTYLKIRLKYLFFVLVLRQDLQKENFFNYKINFFNYSTFVFLFEEIFICQVYNFAIKKKKPLIFDCGANIGVSTIYFKMINPNSRILAFEPDFQAYLKLKENVKKNSFKNIKILNEAVSDRFGYAEFYGDSKSLNNSLESKRAGDINKRKVKISFLSSYVNSIVDFIKMDIEGAEQSVFEELKKRGKLALVSSGVVEYHHHIEKGNDNLGSFLSIFEKAGFGYQIKSDVKSLFNRGQYQDILVFFYQKKLLLTN